MRISKLYDRFTGDNTIAMILGTGPSMRCFPLQSIRGAFVVGLNQAWRYWKPNLMLTAHPELYQEFAKERPDPHTLEWVIKKKPPMDTLELDDPKHYVYNTSSDPNVVTTQPSDILYIGEGIQCTAIDLLTRMGAKTILMIGCDMTNLGGDFHGHDQHVRFLGQTPEEQYALYRKTTARVRSLVRDKFGVSVLTLSPFIGLNGAEEDYRRLRGELKLPPLPKPKDTSLYVREEKMSQIDRYENLYTCLDNLPDKVHTNGVTFLEVGTYDGRRAGQLCEYWRQQYDSSFTYIGFDLFEDMDRTTNTTEFSKPVLPPAKAIVEMTLKRVHARTTLIKGNTRDTIPTFVDYAKGIVMNVIFNVIFIDGGHSLETVASDWNSLQPLITADTIVLMDDYYENRDDYGCRQLVTKLQAESKFKVTLLDPVDKIENNGLQIRMVMIRLLSKVSVPKAA